MLIGYEMVLLQREIYKYFRRDLPQIYDILPDMESRLIIILIIMHYHICVLVMSLQLP